jgi:hypothetical protein
MDDNTQICIYTLTSLPQGDIEEPVVPETREKASLSWVPTGRVFTYSKHDIGIFCSRMNGTIT